jgi:hypothetical protein
MADHPKIDDDEFDKRVFRKIMEGPGLEYYLEKNPGLTREELLEMVDELHAWELTYENLCKMAAWAVTEIAATAKEPPAPK